MFALTEGALIAAGGEAALETVDRAGAADATRCIVGNVVGVKADGGEGGNKAGGAFPVPACTECRIRLCWIAARPNGGGGVMVVWALGGGCWVVMVVVVGVWWGLWGVCVSVRVRVRVVCACRCVRVWMDV
jgi:hypothetical protein